eukprot:ANDGO_01252.mRNA.1 Glutamate--tRNA ligase
MTRLHPVPSGAQPLVISFSKNCIPHASFLVARLSELDVLFAGVNDDSMFRAHLSVPARPDVVGSPLEIRGNAAIAKYLANLAFSTFHSGKTGAGASASANANARARAFLPVLNAGQELEEEQLVELVLTEVVNDSLEVTLQRLNAYLAMRTFLAGHSLSYVDFLLYEQLRRVSKWTPLLAQFGPSHFPHLVRWFVYLDAHPDVLSACKELSAAIKNFATTKRVLGPGRLDGAAADNEGSSASNGSATKTMPMPFSSSASSSSSGSASTSGPNNTSDDEFNLSLQGAKPGAVCTRFPPEPSGYLHIGHVKAALINDYFARKYQGRLLLRFDDTNPAKEKEEFEKAITADLARLNIFPDAVSYTSDHFPVLLKYAEQFIREGLAYVDDTPVEQLRDEKFHGRESRCREQSVEANLLLWEEMKAGKRPDCVLRSKISMTSKNKTMRDPVMYRTVKEPHARTGTTYSIYPTYDFACPIVDSIEGVTHALRSLEYQERNEQYEWFLAASKVRPVYIWGFSRMNFMYALLSKRKLTHFVNKGVVDGWNDPRFPTVQGLLRHGLSVQALRFFVLAQGASKNQNLMSWERLWAENRKVLDPSVPRYTAIDAANVVQLDLVGGDGLPAAGVEEYRALPRHRKTASLGTKMVAFSRNLWISQADALTLADGEEITLMDWGNVFVRRILYSKDNAKVVERVEAELNLKGDFRKTSKKITWLARSQDVVEGSCSWFDHLITKEKLEEDDKLEDWINAHSRLEKRMLCDPNVRLIQRGEKFQFERVGFFICDAPLISKDKGPVFFEIPDGHERKNKPGTPMEV